MTLLAGLCFLGLGVLASWWIRHRRKGVVPPPPETDWARVGVWAAILAWCAAFWVGVGFAVGWFIN